MNEFDFREIYGNPTPQPTTIHSTLKKDTKFVQRSKANNWKSDIVAFFQLKSKKDISTEGDKTLEACIDAANISDGASLPKKVKAFTPWTIFAKKIIAHA